MSDKELLVILFIVFWFLYFIYECKRAMDGFVASHRRKYIDMIKRCKKL